ncbi:hypothetical protein V6N13_138306 [Hibiscus sabdariffa]
MLQLQSKKENFDTQPVAGGSLFATLEVLDGEVVVAAKLKTVSTSWRTDNGKAHARLKEVVVGNVVIKNAAYITLNQNKHSKDANKATQVTGVINLVGVIPTVARQSTTVVAHSSCARNGCERERVSRSRGSFTLDGLVVHSFDEEDMIEIYDEDEMTS